jgi:hypothetical protein
MRPDDRLPSDWAAARGQNAVATCTAHLPIRLFSAHPLSLGTLNNWWRRAAQVGIDERTAAGTVLASSQVRPLAFASPATAMSMIARRPLIWQARSP